MLLSVSFFGSEKMRYVPPKNYDYCVWMKQEWNVVGLWTTNGVKVVYDSSGGFTEMKISIIIVREWKVYLWRIFVPIILITLCKLLSPLFIRVAFHRAVSKTLKFCFFRICFHR